MIMIWRKASTCEFAIARLRHLCRKIGLLALAVVCATPVEIGASGGSKDWIVLENCRLIPNPANDGDSFHVSAGAKEYIFRLYLVDAPETDEMTPGRLVEQAKYFGIGVPQTIEVGQAAKDFTREKLSQPFIAFTHMSDALGQSRLERFYAFVQTNEGDLGEQLVRNGLARIHGYKAAPPGLRNSRVELQKLQLFEQQARQEKIGAWGLTVGRLNIHAENQSGFSFFIPAEKPRSRATPAIPFSSPKPGASVPFRSAPNPSRSHGKAKTPLGKIDVNTATEKELTTVPGIGHVMAARIIAARPFRSADDLRRVSGIGDKKYAEIRPYFQ